VNAVARVLITRPAALAERTAARARALGHDVLLAPVMAVAPREGPPPATDDVAAVLVTSRNAVPSAARLASPRPVFAVGEGTAEALAAAGVEVTDVAAGDGASLARLVAARLDARAGALLHPTGEVWARGLADALTAAGFDYRPWVVYAAEPTSTLPPAALAALRGGEIDAVTLHSPRSARFFAERVHEAGLDGATEHATALCLSANVAAAARALRWCEVRIAARSDESGMGGLLEDLEHRC
jgi:uroporphyrinogen-III synthase